MHQTSKICSSDIETGIIKDENISDSSEIFNDSEMLLSDSDFYDNNISCKNIQSNGLNEFVEILEKKKHDSLKIKTSKKMLSDVSNNQISNFKMKSIEDDYTNDQASKKLSILEMIAPLRTNIVTSSYLNSLHGENIFNSSNNTLNVPLVKTIQDRFDREAAYDIVKKELEKWKDIVKFNRESEMLKFPVDFLEKEKLTNSSLSAKFKASTLFEESIDKALQSSGLKDEKSISEFEKLHTDKCFVKDAGIHHAEFRLMRDLMFRQECKAKRISKIKSKLYRKIRRHEKKKIKSLVSDKTDCEELCLQKEINRVKERMGFHCSSANKWAKKCLIDTYSNADSFQFMSKQLQCNQHFKRKIQGTYSSDSHDLDNINEDNLSYKKGMLMDLKKFNQNENIKSLKDLMDMQFMESSKKNRNAKNKEILDDILRVEKNSEILCKEYSDNKNFECFSHFAGRRIFNPLLEFIEISEIEQSSDLTDKKLSCSQSLNDSNACSKNHNPWLFISYKSSLELRGPELDHNIENSILHKNTKEYKTNESGLYIDLSDELLFSISTIEQDKYSDNIEEGNTNMLYSSSSFALKHRDIVARAFSGDNVLEKFEKEKFKDIKEYESYENNDSMPGW
ncbi:unnamed protein product, partial [Pneumocystis jirovecii]